MPKLCRFCLTAILDQKYTEFSPDSNDSLIVIQKFHCCVPNIDIGLVKKWVICNVCMDAVNYVFDFARVCLKSQMLIRDYIANVGCEGPVDELNNSNRDLIVKGKSNQISEVNIIRTISRPSRNSKKRKCQEMDDVIVLDDTEDESPIMFSVNQPSRQQPQPQPILISELELQPVQINTVSPGANEMQQLSNVPTQQLRFIVAQSVADAEVESQKVNNVIVIDDIDQLPTISGVNQLFQNQPIFISEMEVQPVESNTISLGQNEVLQPNVPLSELTITTAQSNAEVENSEECDTSSVQQSNISLSQCDNDKNAISCKTYFMCSTCNEVFSHNKHLIKHIQNHPSCTVTPSSSSSNNTIETQSEAETSNSEKHTCENCNYDTFNTSQYVNHMRKHTGPEPYECQICNHRCMQDRSVRRHLRFNVEKLLYECKICHYKCSVKEILQYFMHSNGGGENDVNSKRITLPKGKPLHKRTNCIESACIMQDFHKNSTQEGGDIEASNEHIAVNEDVFICYTCHEQFTDKELLQIHVLKHRIITQAVPSNKNAKNNFIQCDYCCFKTPDKLIMLNHIRLHTKEKPFLCQYCQFACSHSSTLIKHMRNHPEMEFYKCCFCNYQCGFGSNFQRHLRMHTSLKPFECGICHEKVGSLQMLSDHMKYHPQEKLDRLNALSSNIRVNRFIQISGHKRQKPDTGTLSLSNNESVMTNTNNFICSTCGKVFSDKEELQSHIQGQCLAITETSNSESEKNVGTDSEQILLKCMYCDFISSSESALASHNQKHKEDKFHKCDVCDLEFDEVRHLRQHYRVHIDIRPYKCGWCPYQVVNETTLEDHMNVHTGKTPYHCKFCDYKTAFRRGLYGHLRTHGGQHQGPSDSNQGVTIEASKESIAAELENLTCSVNDSIKTEPYEEGYVIKTEGLASEESGE